MSLYTELNDSMFEEMLRRQEEDEYRRNRSKRDAAVENLLGNPFASRSYGKYVNEFIREGEEPHRKYVAPSYDKKKKSDFRGEYIINGFGGRGLKALPKGADSMNDVMNFAFNRFVRDNGREALRLPMDEKMELFKDAFLKEYATFRTRQKASAVRGNKRSGIKSLVEQVRQSVDYGESPEGIVRGNPYITDVISGLGRDAFKFLMVPAEKMVSGVEVNIPDSPYYDTLFKTAESLMSPRNRHIYNIANNTVNASGWNKLQLLGLENVIGNSNGNALDILNGITYGEPVSEESVYKMTGEGPDSYESDGLKLLPYLLKSIGEYGNASPKSANGLKRELLDEAENLRPENVINSVSSDPGYSISASVAKKLLPFVMDNASYAARLLFPKSTGLIK